MSEEVQHWCWGGALCPRPSLCPTPQIHPDLSFHPDLPSVASFAWLLPMRIPEEPETARPLCLGVLLSHGKGNSAPPPKPKAASDFVFSGTLTRPKSPGLQFTLPVPPAERNVALAPSCLHI